MKKFKWKTDFTGALIAAGILAPNQAKAVDIPLGDPSFDDFAVPALFGYAYADAYRPTSAWVDDLDSPVGYSQDDPESNWLYDAAYAEDPLISRRPAPRTGNQAMHGFFHYNAQETGAVFEAQMTYTFSMWAQGDEISTPSSRVFLYFFDGTIPFSDANSLASQRFAPDTGDFVNRPAGSTPDESRAAWTQISLSYTVQPGAPEVGHTIGVGFWIAGDGAVDDAALTFVPEPGAVYCIVAGGLLLVRRRRRVARVP